MNIMTLSITELRWPLAQSSRMVPWSDRTAEWDAEESEDGPATFAYWEAANVADKDGDGELWTIVHSGTVERVHIGESGAFGPLVERHEIDDWTTDVDPDDYGSEESADFETARREGIESRVTLFEDDASNYAPGPQMNYVYPVIDDTDDAERNGQWAYNIRHLPLCVVELDGYTGLALTGGGMDLSWEIAEAFVRIGYRPPVDVCGTLPRMAGMTINDDRRAIVQVIVETLRNLAANHADAADRLAAQYLA